MPLIVGELDRVSGLDIFRVRMPKRLKEILFRVGGLLAGGDRSEVGSRDFTRTGDSAGYE